MKYLKEIVLAASIAAAPTASYANIPNNPYGSESNKPTNSTVYSGSNASYSLEQRVGIPDYGADNLTRLMRRPDNAYSLQESYGESTQCLIAYNQYGKWKRKLKGYWNRKVTPTIRKAKRQIRRKEPELVNDYDKAKKTTGKVIKRTAKKWWNFFTK